jgi:SAM-dependent methyltransferase
LKSHDPTLPEVPAATPAPVADEDDGAPGRAPFSVTEGDFSTPVRRRRTITRPRGLRALEAPQPAAAGVIVDHEALREVEAYALTTPPPEDNGAESDLVASSAASPTSLPMSAVDEFLASPPTPVPEVTTRRTDVSPRVAATGDTDGLGTDAAGSDGTAGLSSSPEIPFEDESISVRSLATDGLSYGDGARGDQLPFPTMGDERPLATPAPVLATPMTELPVAADPSAISSSELDVEIELVLTPRPSVAPEPPPSPIPSPPAAALRSPTPANVPIPTPAPIASGPATPARTLTPARPVASARTPTPTPRMHRARTPPPIPRDALVSPLTPSPHSVGLPSSVPSAPDSDDLSTDGYVEASTFPAGGSPRSLRGTGVSDRSPASGSVPIIENASAGAEMRLAALGADTRTDPAIETVLDVEQQVRDEAMVDELLRRATEQMLSSADAAEQAAAPAAGSPVVEPEPAPSLPSRLSVEPAAARGAAPAPPPPPPEEASPLAAADLHEIVADEPVTELHPHSTSGAHLSPLAQTLAHMAEALHSDVTEDGGLEIDIVDGPLISGTRQPPAPSVAIPPPLPSSVVAASGSTSPEPAGVVAPVPEPLAERPRVPRRSKAWYEEVFDENYLRTLPFMTAEQTLREVDFIEAGLVAPKGAQILDIGCGYGRHAIELVQRGLAVTGLDLSLPLLIRAADEAQKRALSVNFVHSDMRGLAFDREFDGAYCMLTSFGYFDEESNLKVAEGIARALKPGGRFLLDVVNRDYIVGDLPARIWWEGDGCVVLEEVEFNFNTSRILTHRSVVFEDGRQLDQEISVRAYSLHELGKLLRQSGFRVIDVSGSIYTPGRLFGAASRNLIVLAERRRD